MIKIVEKLSRFFSAASVAFLAFLNLSCSTGRVALDPVTSSTASDGDGTGIVEGCGNQPIVGFSYCRMSEGDNTSQKISFIGPPAKCNQKDACVFIKIWNNQNQLVAGPSIPKGKTRVDLSWQDLVQSPTFQVGMRGIWTWNTVVYYLGPDGKERRSVAQGDIVLRVYKKGYVDLHTIDDDPAYVWEWTEGSNSYKMTSGLRAVVKKAAPQ